MCVVKYPFNMERFFSMKLLGCWVILLLTPCLTDTCQPTPQILKNAVDTCAKSLSENERALIASTEPDNGKLKDFSLCFYTSVGYFRNGTFDLEYINKFLMDSHPDKELVQRVYEWSEIHLKEANAVQGNDNDRTYSFWLQSFEEEAKNLRAKLWC